MPGLLGLVLLLLLTGLAGSSADTTTTAAAAASVPPHVAWLDPPVVLADDRALRLDVQTASILLRAEIVLLIACSAVDKPVVAYDAALPRETGCASPGFFAAQIYPALNASEAHAQHVPFDMYAVRKRARSMFIKRRLLDPHSPSVWLQATLQVRDEHGRVVADAGHVEMVRFQVPERVLALDVTLPPLDSGSDGTSFVGRMFNFLSFGFRSDLDAGGPVLRDYDELDGREDMNNGTSTRYYNHVHWTSYTAVICGGLFIVVVLVVVLLRWSRRGGTRWGRKGGKSRDHLSDGGEDLERGRTRKIAGYLEDVKGRGLYHDDFL
jgi:hypothetical protein